MESNYFLGVRIDNLNQKSLLLYLKKILDSDKFIMLTPINPEMLITARENLKFKKVLNNSELNPCDGAGISLAFRLASMPMSKYPGSLMINNVLKFAEKNNQKIFFLGANNESNKKARENVIEKFPNIKIKGYSPPREKRTEKVFYDDEQIKIFNLLREFKPDILCVFFGAPFQETWLTNNRNELRKIGLKLGVSLGGTADFLSGKIKKAPEIWQRLNLEWLYRLTTEKNRFKRFITRIPKFIFFSLKWAFLEKKKINKPVNREKLYDK